MEKYNSRAQVPDKYKWKLDDFYKTEADFEKQLTIVSQKITKFNAYYDCVKDANKLLEFLQLQISVLVDLYNLYVFSELKVDEELGMSENISRKGKVEKLLNDYDLSCAFFTPSLLKLSKDKYIELFKDNADLLEYKDYLDTIYRYKDYLLTENEEKIVAELTKNASSFEAMNSEIINSENEYGTIYLSNGTKEELMPANLRIFLKDKDVKVRRKAYNTFYKTIGQYASTSAGLLNQYVGLNNSIAKVRKFKSAWDKKVYDLNISNSVYDTLVKTTESKLDYFQKYIKLKKKILNIKNMHQYDMSLDISDNDNQYTIEEAQAILLEAIKPLGEDYREHFKRIFDNQYIDYCKYKGKQSGGYSCSTLDHDSRIFMSYNYDFISISTIAHECGHNVHHQYIMANNPLHYREVSNIVAEVASLTNEFLLSDYFSKNGKTKAEKKNGVANAISIITSNLYGAVREGKLEQDFNEYVLNGNVITKDYLNEISLKSLQKYYGNTIVVDDLSKYNWVTRSHYYMNFYLYSYAICVSVAAMVSSEIIKGNKEMLNKYLKFLTLGSNVWPIDAFKLLGYDIEKEDVYLDALEYYNELIDKFEMIENDKEV